VSEVEQELLRAWEAIEDGRFEEALELLAPLPEDLFERHAYAVHAWLRMGELARARASLAVLEQEAGGDDVDVAWLRGLVRLAEGEPGAALACFDAIETDDPAWRAEILAERALALDHLGDAQGARRALELAHAADPEAHPAPLLLGPEEFDSILARAAEALPEEFRRTLEEVPVVVEPVPSRALLATGLPPDLLGLWDPGEEEAPPRILLFQRNLERAFPEREALAREIETTLYHELGHALGFDEDGLEEIGLD
jgi:predicted Zn-dependent protease with MMP-like domain